MNMFIGLGIGSFGSGGERIPPPPERARDNCEESVVVGCDVVLDFIEVFYTTINNRENISVGCDITLNYTLV